MNFTAYQTGFPLTSETNAKIAMEAGNCYGLVQGLHRREDCVKGRRREICMGREKIGMGGEKDGSLMREMSLINGDPRRRS